MPKRFDNNITLHTVMDTVLDGIIIIDTRGVMVAFNKAAEKMFGYTGDEVIGKNVSMLMPMRHGVAHDSYIHNYLKTGQASIIGIGRQLEAVKKSGEIFPIELAIGEMELGGERLFVGTIHDMSTRVATNAKFLREKSYLELAEKVAMLGHWRLDLKESCLFWSDEIYNIHGVQRGDYTPSLLTAIDFYHPEDRSVVKSYLEEAIEKKKSFKFELRLIRPDGMIRHVMSKGECELDHEGNVESVFGIFQDVTEQTAAQLELYEMQMFQQLVIDTNPSFIFVKDQAFRIQLANKAFLGLYPEEMQNSIIGNSTIEQYDEEEAEEFLAEDKKAFAEGYSSKIEELLFPDGLRRTLYTQKVRFENSEAEPFILGVAVDITELKETEEELRLANAELEEFAYRTSHDLRSPLVSSLGLLKVLDHSIRAKNEEKACQITGMLETSLTQLEQLVKNILELTKTKNFDEPKNLVDVEKMVEESIEKISHMDHFSAISIKKNVHVEKEIYCKVSRLRLIVENLLSNAVKYHDPEKEQPFVRIEAHTGEKYFELIVEDNGLGIPKDQHDKLFKMFKRFHPKTAFGSGLGMYMMKKSASIIEGDLMYVDKGHGSRFILSIPMSALEVTNMRSI